MSDPEQQQDLNGLSDKTSSVPGSEEDSQTEQLTEISGWLMKRTKISHKWKKKWFHLKQTDLYYGDSAQNTPKKIPLDAAEIAESSIDNKENAFRIRPQDSKRVHYVHTDDEAMLQNWMQAICFAKAAGRTGDQSQACVVQ